ncbi:DUF4404 family protein [Spirochaeta cellobiosiphila]|uniref:DUF4404 family protein n=1 Tax=Spirochaeta cellobiosiphila TaxID=504483 RepID=UPI0004142438|nr:DUF4404 family protein [Spirochaeta cellobiosiphila]
MLQDKIDQLEQKISKTQLPPHEKKDLQDSIDMIKGDLSQITDPTGDVEETSLIAYFRRLEAAHPDLTKALDKVCQSLSDLGI